jgi:hypothetical protein
MAPKFSMKVSKLARKRPAAAEEEIMKKPSAPLKKQKLLTMEDLKKQSQSMSVSEKMAMVRDHFLGKGPGYEVTMADGENALQVFEGDSRNKVWGQFKTARRVNEDTHTFDNKHISYRYLT